MRISKKHKLHCFVCGKNTNFISLKKLGYCEANNYLCKKCGLVFIPRESKSTHVYYKKDGYFKKSPALSVRKAFVSRSMLMNLGERQIKKSLAVKNVDFSSKRVLDVGCAYGENLYYLQKKYKSNVLGLEPSSEASSLGEYMFHVKIMPLLLEELKINKKFDIIICNHTLEHVDDPDSFMERVKKLLTKDGLLYLEVPNLLKPTGGFSLNKFLYNEHLQNFTAYALYSFLKKKGFSIIALSDKDFLKCWSIIENKDKSLVKEITYKDILKFLKKYRENYSFKNTLKVYAGKGLYLSSLCYHKIIDIKYNIFSNS